MLQKLINVTGTNQSLISELNWMEYNCLLLQKANLCGLTRLALSLFWYVKSKATPEGPLQRQTGRRWSGGITWPARGIIWRAYNQSREENIGSGNIPQENSMILSGLTPADMSSWSLNSDTYICIRVTRFITNVHKWPACMKHHSPTHHHIPSNYHHTPFTHSLAALFLQPQWQPWPPARC